MESKLVALFCNHSPKLKFLSGRTPTGAMFTRLSVQIGFTEIESMLFSNIFQRRIHVLDKEGDAGRFRPSPKMFWYIAYTVFLSRIIDKCSRAIQRYIAKTSHIRLPTHSDD